MSETLARLKTESSNLSVQERVELAHFLLGTLEQDGREGMGGAWDVELAQRAEEIENGKVTGIPAADVFARLEQKYRSQI